ncbi:MAG: hypothetical protein U9N73_05655, partial [Candidatus Auribacterota bacterium]|nr:hypothetical protein [Candidatus Auribacterota bacterium]
VNAERGGELKHEKQRLEEEISNIIGNISAGAKESDQLKQSRNKLVDENKKRDNLLREKEDGLRVLRNERGVLEKELSELQSQSLESSRREGHIRNELSGLQVGGKELALRKRKLEVELEGTGEEEEELRIEVEEAAPRLKEEEEEISVLKGRREEERLRLREIEEGISVSRKRKEELLVAISKLESRKQILKNWDEDEPRTAVDILLSGLKTGEFSGTGVIGPLEEYIKFQAGSEMMVRAVLGEKIYAVLVRSSSDAIGVISYLKGKKAGPIRLIVMEWLKKVETSALNSISGLATLLSPLEGLEHAVFDEVKIADDPGEYSGEPGAGAIVTDEGLKISPPGVIFWVGDGRAETLLNLQEIEAELEELQKEYSELPDTGESGNSRIRESRKQVEEMVGKLHDLEMEFSLSRNEQERRRNSLRKLSLSREAIKNEITELSQEEGRTTGRLTQLELELSECPSQDQIKEKDLASLRERLSERVQSLRKLESEVTDLKISLASSREREDSQTGRLDRLLSENRNLEILLESRRDRIGEDEERGKKLREETDRLRERIEEWERNIEGLRTKIAKMEAEIESLNQGVAAKEEIVRKVRPRFQKVQSRLGSQDVTLAELRIKDQTLCQRMREKYDIELDELEVPEEVDDPEKMVEEIEFLRDKMGRMTDVNLSALADKENYESRHALLTEQKDDLEAAARDIEEAITRINVTAREKLQVTYDTVREHFREIFAHLFGGGKADLILDNEKDILESGLDIIAQPPGKKLSHISLLSGGERALTTIALIFALFKVQPSPFYILDEIDAPLDEANIERFVDLLKTLISEAQFIIITHNKRSISEADILYGITMEESGVSKVVSVRLASGKKPQGKAKLSDPSDMSDRSDSIKKSNKPEDNSNEKNS